MITNPENSDNQHELVASTSGFLVFGSVLFLLERLGTPEIALTWALATAILFTALLFGYSGRTTSAASFFCANRGQSLSENLIGRLADIVSSPLFLLIVFLQSGNSTAVMVLIFIVTAGHGLNGWLFAAILRKSGAYSIADFLGYRFDSKLIRFLALAIVLGMSAALLVTELRLSGLYLAPVLGFSFEQVTGIIIITAGFAGLMGGIASVSKLQSALILLVLVAVTITASWLALKIAGVPLPQLLMNYSGPIIPSQPLIDIRLARELQFAFSLIESSGFWLPLFLICGYIAFPYLGNRSFLAISPVAARRGSIRSLILTGFLLTSIPALYYLTAANVQAGNSMPAVLQIFVPVSVLMIAISSTALLLTIMANTLSHDGYQLLRPGKVPMNRQIFMARIAIVVFAYFGWTYATSPKIESLSLLIWAIGFSISSLFPIMLVAAFWPGLSKLAGLTGMGTGVALVGAGYFVLETEYGQSIARLWFPIEFNMNIHPAILIGLGSMLAVFVILFLFSWIKRPDPALLEKLKNLRDPGKEILIVSNK